MHSSFLFSRCVEDLMTLLAGKIQGFFISPYCVTAAGPSGDTSGNIAWGEIQTATRPSSWGFPAFDLKTCGHSLFGNVTSSWPAIISTGSACLGLPEEVPSQTTTSICFAH